MTGWVNLERSSPISRHLSICSEAKDSTYVRDVDLKSWAELPGKKHSFYIHKVEQKKVSISVHVNWALLLL